MQNLETQPVLDALKELLRERGFSYSTIADRLGVSLPTVKRLLNKSSIPLDKLLEVCRLAEVSLETVLERAQVMAPRHTEFTKEQDELFASRPGTLSFFSELFHQRRRPSEIARRHKLSKVSTERYLKLLEGVGLLERLPGNKVKFLVSPPLGFSPKSKMLQRLQSEFMERITNEVVLGEEKGTKGRFAVMKPLRLTEKEYRGFVEELMQVVDRYSFLSESPRGQETESVQWQFAAAAGEAKEQRDEPIPNLE